MTPKQTQAFLDLLPRALDFAEVMLPGKVKRKVKRVLRAVMFGQHVAHTLLQKQKKDFFE